MVCALLPTRRLLAIAAASAWLAGVGVAHAAGPIGNDGDPITTSDYAVDLSQGVVLGGSRATGLGGAYVAIGEGVSGNLYNPAAPAVRAAYSFQDTRFDLGFGAAFPAGVSEKDYFNSGSRTDVGAPRSNELAFVFLEVVGNLQDGPWGGAIAFDFQTYGLRRSETPGGATADELTARFTTTHLQLARRLGDFSFGIGSRLTGLTILRNREPIFDTTGSAVELGAHYRPTNQQFRVGFALHSQVDPSTGTGSDEVVKTADGDQLIPADPDDPTTLDDALYIPARVTLPWEVAAGVAFQIGRPFNPEWDNPEALVVELERYLRWREQERRRWRRHVLALAREQGRDPEALGAAIDAQINAERALDQEQLRRARRTVDTALRTRYAALSRRYLLVSAAVHVTGPLEDAVGVESFLERTVHRAGLVPTYSPRLGLESEVIPRWLTLRAGSYYEPTRFSSPDAAARLHGTFGMDLRLIKWKVFGLVHEDTYWRATGSVDYAARYLSFGAGLGIWH
jgi:hypothetical protein